MWSERRQALALLACGLALPACGFRPLYKPRGGVGGVADLAYVKVARIEDRAGQLVRNELLELLNPAGLSVKQVYLLSVKLQETKEGLAFQKDDSVTRFNLRLVGKFVMRDLRVDKTVLEGRSRSIAAYNVVKSDYANLVAEKDARSRAASNVAQEIASRVAIYFERLRAEGHQVDGMG